MSEQPLNHLPAGLRGRAAYIRNMKPGAVKTPEALEQAAARIDALEAKNKALRDSLKETLRALEYWYRPDEDEPVMPGSIIGRARNLLAKGGE